MEGGDITPDGRSGELHPDYYHHDHIPHFDWQQDQYPMPPITSSSSSSRDGRSHSDVYRQSFTDDKLEERQKREAATDAYMPDLSEIRFEDVEMSARAQAHESALELIRVLRIKSAHTPRPLQVATAESLTAGLIFSTLVDVPFGGLHKYGSFAVYDTDAKRTFLGVTTSNVYTHECVEQMARGVLRNSNASVAIAVSGNAMPEQGGHAQGEKLSQLGEVYIGVAGYAVNTQTNAVEIIVQSRVYNFCDHLARNKSKAALPDIWIETVAEETFLYKYLKAHHLDDVLSKIPRITNGYNEFTITSQIASFIRLKTVAQACTDAAEFVLKHQLVVPDFIKKAPSEHDHADEVFLKLERDLTHQTEGERNTYLMNGRVGAPVPIVTRLKNTANSRMHAPAAPYQVQETHAPGWRTMYSQRPPHMQY
jgi:nicotinamide mononucleotide (NMN) deamidase PncC